MAERVEIIGSYLSPYVRKVLVCLDLKGIAYSVDPIVPFYGDDRFTALSPLRRIPVLRDDRVTLADSSVICQYLEDRYPSPPLYPADVADRARARWFEEYADSRMGEVFIWHLFNQMAIKQAVWGENSDREVLDRALNREIPEILDYLERTVPAEGFLCGGLSIADISVATFFRNAAFVRYEVDANRWPLTAAYVKRVLGTDGFEKLKPIEDKLCRVPVAEHRNVLAQMGAPLTETSFGTNAPRRGVMHID